jgi:catechol 2,3-dioxygenase-like lactoylglutathione lyase family enzyme
MAIELDHLILPVSDVARTIDFYVGVIGLTRETDNAPFAVLRVTPRFVILLAPWGTTGGEHLAFAMSPAEFDAAFDRIKTAGIPYGDRFDDVGNMMGPADESGSRGMGRSLYVFDPDRHLIEIRHYGANEAPAGEPS